MSSIKNLTPAESADIDHPSQDCTRRHETDQLLRRHGYRIHARVSDAEPEWLDKNGIVVMQGLALEKIATKK